MENKTGEKTSKMHKKRNGPYRNELLQAATGEDSVKLRSQFAFRQQREDDRFRQQGFQRSFAVDLAVKADEHARRFAVFGFQRRWQGAVVEEVAQTSAVQKTKNTALAFEMIHFSSQSRDTARNFSKPIRVST